MSESDLMDVKVVIQKEVYELSKKIVDNNFDGDWSKYVEELIINDN